MPAHPTYQATPPLPVYLPATVSVVLELIAAQQLIVSETEAGNVMLRKHQGQSSGTQDSGYVQAIGQPH